MSADDGWSKTRAAPPTCRSPAPISSHAGSSNALLVSRTPSFRTRSRLFQRSSSLSASQHLDKCHEVPVTHCSRRCEILREVLQRLDLEHSNQRFATRGRYPLRSGLSPAEGMCALMHDALGRTGSCARRAARSSSRQTCRTSAASTTRCCVPGVKSACQSARSGLAPRRLRPSRPAAQQRERQHRRCDHEKQTDRVQHGSCALAHASVHHHRQRRIRADQHQCGVEIRE